MTWGSEGSSEGGSAGGSVEYGSILGLPGDSWLSVDDVFARFFFPMRNPRKIKTAAATTDPTTGPAIQARLSVPEGEGDSELVAWNIINIIRRLHRRSGNIPDGVS